MNPLHVLTIKTCIPSMAMCSVVLCVLGRCIAEMHADFAVMLAVHSAACLVAQMPTALDFSINEKPHSATTMPSSTACAVLLF